MISFSKGKNNNIVIKIRGVVDASEVGTIGIVWLKNWHAIEAKADSIIRWVISAIVPWFKYDYEVINEKVMILNQNTKIIKDNHDMIDWA